MTCTFCKKQPKFITLKQECQVIYVCHLISQFWYIFWKSCALFPQHLGLNTSLRNSRYLISQYWNAGYSFSFGMVVTFNNSQNVVHFFRLYQFFLKIRTYENSFVLATITNNHLIYLWRETNEQINKNCYQEMIAFTARLTLQHKFAFFTMWFHSGTETCRSWGGPQGSSTGPRP